MKHRLCFDCLGRDYMRFQCSQRATCEVCKGAHPTLLHRSRASTDQTGFNPSGPGADSASVSTSVGQPHSSSSGVPAVTSAAVKRCHTLLETMPIVPVRVKSVFGYKECCTYAFLDLGSSDTLMTEHLMRDFSLCGKRTTINLTTLNADSVPTPCFAVSNLEVCGLNEFVFVPLPVVFTQESMPVSREQVSSQEDINRWTYLSHIAVPALDAEIGILIEKQCTKGYGAMGSGELPWQWSVRSAFSPGFVGQWSFEVCFSWGRSVSCVIMLHASGLQLGWSIEQIFQSWFQWESCVCRVKGSLSRRSTVPENDWRGDSVPWWTLGCESSFAESHCVCAQQLSIGSSGAEEYKEEIWFWSFLQDEVCQLHWWLICEGACQSSAWWRPC